MFVPETLISALNELTAEYERARNDQSFKTNWTPLLRGFAAGRLRSIWPNA